MTMIFNCQTLITCCNCSPHYKITSCNLRDWINYHHHYLSCTGNGLLHWLLKDLEEQRNTRMDCKRIISQVLSLKKIVRHLKIPSGNFVIVGKYCQVNCCLFWLTFCYSNTLLHSYFLSYISFVRSFVLLKNSLSFYSTIWWCLFVFLPFLLFGNGRPCQSLYGALLTQ